MPQSFSLAEQLQQMDSDSNAIEWIFHHIESNGCDYEDYILILKRKEELQARQQTAGSLCQKALLLTVLLARYHQHQEDIKAMLNSNYIARNGDGKLAKELLREIAEKYNNSFAKIQYALYVVKHSKQKEWKVAEKYLLEGVGAKKTDAMVGLATLYHLQGKSEQATRMMLDNFNWLPIQPKLGYIKMCITAGSNAQYPIQHLPLVLECLDMIAVRSDEFDKVEGFPQQLLSLYKEIKQIMPSHCDTPFLGSYQNLYQLFSEMTPVLPTHSDITINFENGPGWLKALLNTSTDIYAKLVICSKDQDATMAIWAKIAMATIELLGYGTIKPDTNQYRSRMDDITKQYLKMENQSNTINKWGGDFALALQQLDNLKSKIDSQKHSTAARHRASVTGLCKRYQVGATPVTKDIGKRRATTVKSAPMGTPPSRRSGLGVTAK